MRAATLFSGVGAPEVAMPSWQWLWGAEVEPFPSAVLAARHPDSVNLGDVDAGDLVERARAVGRPDVVVFGSPCQDFSVAGKRAGVDGARGRLTYRAVEVVGAVRPRWFVFENVPNLLAIDDGHAFGGLLHRLGERGYQCAWRVLDAQYFRTPQRRRRLFVVGHLGDWRRAAAVLFEPEGLRRDPAPRRSPRSGVAAPLTHSAARRRGGGQHADTFIAGLDDGETARALNASHTSTGRLDASVETFVISETADPLTVARKYTHEGKNFRLPNVVLDMKNGRSRDEAVGTLRSNDSSTANNAVLCFDPTQITHPENRSQPDDRSPQLNESGHSPVAITFKSSHYTRGKDGAPSDVLGTLSADTDKGDQDALILDRATVRRLMPVEWERLQGFPDDYTLIRYRGGPAKDTPRCAALGNAMNVEVMRWILRRLEMVEAIGG